MRTLKCRVQGTFPLCPLPPANSASEWTTQKVEPKNKYFFWAYYSCPPLFLWLNRRTHSSTRSSANWLRIHELRSWLIMVVSGSANLQPVRCQDYQQERNGSRRCRQIKCFKNKIIDKTCPRPKTSVFLGVTYSARHWPIHVMLLLRRLLKTKWRWNAKTQLLSSNLKQFLILRRKAVNVAKITFHRLEDLFHFFCLNHFTVVSCMSKQSKCFAPFLATTWRYLLLLSSA